MYKDILLVLGKNGAAASYALSFAKHFEAEVTAVRPGQGHDEDDEVAATRALMDFIARATKRHVTAHMIPVSESEHGDALYLSNLARRFDLAIVEQSTPEQHAFAGGRIGSMVSQCGRPVLITPYIQREPADFDNVVVAWDASASAARAVGDAIPILQRAKSVEIVTVVNAKAGSYLPSGGEVAQHLAKHGIDAVFREIPGGIDAAEMLLSYAADTGAKLMVAGAYGHSRMVETIAGGATRTLLESMTIPMFMSH